MILSLILGMVFSVIALFIIYGLIHLFATKLFKGEGTLRGMIVRGNIWTTGTYLALSVAASIQSIILMNTIIDKFEGVNLGASYEAMQQYNEAILGVTIPILFIYGIAWLAWSFAMSRITARNYGLDFSKGCGSLFIMNVSLFVLLCGCSFALGMVVMSFFSTPY
jgi:hypothetical protein